MMIEVVGVAIFSIACMSIATIYGIKKMTEKTKV